MKNKKFSIAIIFTWVGFIGAISFMEAWLKFQAPGITTALGLGIGKLVFAALNKVEITFSVLLLILNRKMIYSIRTLFIIPIVIVAIQSIWLLPLLNLRADTIIIGIDVAESNLHFWYVFLEILKIGSLIYYGLLNTEKSTPIKK